MVVLRCVDVVLCCVLYLIFVPYLGMQCLLDLCDGLWYVSLGKVIETTVNTEIKSAEESTLDRLLVLKIMKQGSLAIDLVISLALRFLSDERSAVIHRIIN